MDGSAIVVGVDPSLTCTGVCVGTLDGEFTTASFSSKPQGTTAADRIRRYETLLRDVLSAFDERDPVLIVVEGYSYGSQTSGMTQAMITEFGGLLRWHLLDLATVFEVPPANLKQFATGKGNCKKELVMAHVQKNWGHMFSTSDECDAFVLYQMARGVLGACELNKKQSEAVDKVTALNGCTAADVVARTSEPPF